MHTNYDDANILNKLLCKHTVRVNFSNCMLARFKLLFEDFELFQKPAVAFQMNKINP